MKTNITVEILKVLLSFFFVILLLINIFQCNNMEKRLIQSASRTEALLDSNKQLRIAVESLTRALETGQVSSKNNGSPDNKKGEISKNEKRKWLHPEVENFLTEEDFVLTPPEAKTDGTIVRYYSTDPKGFNPLTVNDGVFSDKVKNYCMDSFAGKHRTNPDLWKPVMAERIEVTDDYKTYTIYLKKGIKWHAPSVDWSNSRYNWMKGDHYVTAKDVKFTVDLILNPQVECASLRNYYEDLEACEIIDDYTVVFKWKKKVYNSISFTLGFAPIPEFLYSCDEYGKAYPKETLGLKFNEHWYNMKFIGCGPYEFVSYEPGVSVTLKRNEDYYGEKPAIREIIYLIYGDSVQDILKLKSRELDIVSIKASQYREEILDGKPDSPFKNGQIHYENFPTNSFFYIGWNLDNPYFSDKRVRIAMSHAFNSEELLKNIFLGLGTLTTGPFWSESSAYDKTIPRYEFDLDKSRKLLAEAGWKDVDGDGILEKTINGEVKKFEFSLLVFSRSEEWKVTADNFKENLLKVGVKMNLQTLDWAIMQKKMEDKEFDAYTGRWSMSWESDPYQIWHSSQADVPKSSNRIGFRNKDADKIIEDLRVTFDLKKRIELYHRFHKLIHEEEPYTFFYCPAATFVWQDYVKRIMFNKLRPHDDSTPWFIDMEEKNSMSKAAGI